MYLKEPPFGGQKPCPEGSPPLWSGIPARFVDLGSNALVVSFKAVDDVLMHWLRNHEFLAMSRLPMVRPNHE